MLRERSEKCLFVSNRQGITSQYGGSARCTFSNFTREARLSKVMYEISRTANPKTRAIEKVTLLAGVKISSGQ